MNISTEQLKILVNERISFTKVLTKLNPGNHYHPKRPVFCPFHQNENTPSAVIYEDEQAETLWCFSEQKLYKPIDLVSTVLKQDPYAIGLQIWNTLSPFEQQEFLVKTNDFSTASFDKPIKEENKELKSKQLLFKYGKLSYQELLKEYQKHLI